MAYIPYGYRIVRGKAVIDEEKQEQIRLLFSSYLDGNSIARCKEISGCERSVSAIRKMLRNELYRGDGFYPRMVDEELFSKVQIAIQQRKRTLNGSRPKRVPLPVYTMFFLNPQASSDSSTTDPIERAQALYESVIAVPSIPDDSVHATQPAYSTHSSLTDREEKGKKDIREIH